ncbi:hypothetical protein [Rubellimicrobium aerolatum]|uniref:PRC-barrel domain containing protein n=1 Tax=Rubellimicrobium aerolatum TaxID=490979 RepID=A0ABW0SB08_9RHOB|nr:hypothetical protein [Rubellimicrobium aerolatum]MBP1805336.1 hypothetical protein [Rubellimicrobium aerolatum]
MDHPILGAAALGLAAFSFNGLDGAEPPHDGPAALIGQPLYASDEAIPRHGLPPRAEDLALDALGEVSGLVPGPDGEPRALLVAVGGLWGLGSREVELALDRVHSLRAGDGGTRLVVDLSGAATAPDRPRDL